MPPPEVSRRRALSSVASVGLSLPLLSACGDDGSGASGGPDGSSPSSTAADAPSSTAPSSPAPSSSEPAAPESSEPAAPPVDGVAATGDVPVGGGLVVADSEVVITQPTAGEYKVFTAVCTHSGCLVGDVTDTINCPCHQSTFDIATGEPTGGPAPSALDAVDFEISGDQVVLT